MSYARNRQSKLQAIGAIAFLAVLWVHDVQAERKTVCTITVNSSDEKEAFQRSLPPDRYQFVELVEQGRPDWLASACQQHIRCDVLIISGHYDGRDEFYSDREGTHAFLPVEEMERASCSPSCSALFSQLKEVYLFGCNTLNSEALKRPSAEIERSLMHAGHSRAEAERLFRTLSLRHGESSRDRMRLIFKDVPVIYGFSAKAPVGSVAASMLGGYLRSGAGSGTGGGRVSPGLLSHFANTSLTEASGIGDTDTLAGFRRDVCQFSDEDLSPAQKLRFVHRLLGRDVAEVRLFLDRIEKNVTVLAETSEQTPEVSQALADISADRDARDRYLAFMRDADQPAIRARMIALAGRLGWLSEDDKRIEFARLVNDRLARGAVTPADVDLVCALNAEHDLDPVLDRLNPAPEQTDALPEAAIRACLGEPQSIAQVLLALTSPQPDQAQIAQAYLRRRPLAGDTELRELTARIARLSDSAAQIRALDALAGQHLSDRESLEELADLFSVAQSAEVQAAIAAILIRSDYQAIATPTLAATLRESSLTPPGNPGTVDILLRRLKGG